ncbi:hypothetical protein J3459_013622 [Metarhizium acridum]|nr:hypothetical protein J3459_013622 [Metarhizium acridum]
MATTAANFILSNLLGLGVVTITSPTSPVILLLAFSYGDTLLGSCITILNVAVSLAASVGFQGLSDGNALGGIKISLVLCAALRTMSRVAEPLPPAYNEHSKTFDRSFGEMGAGMPGRLFNIAVAEVMYSLGYQGKSAWDVVVAKGWACEIVESGWEAYPMSQELLAWVAVRDDGGYPIL